MTSTATIAQDENTAPGSDDIGKLYDVLGQIAQSESCNNDKGQVVTGLDVLAQTTDSDGTLVDATKKLGNHSYTYPAMCDLDNEQQTTTPTHYYGESYSSYESSYSAQAGLSGSYGFFSGSLDTQYTESSRSVEEYQYMTLAVPQQFGIMTLMNQDALPLETNFEAALNDPDTEAKALFLEWGTHMVVGVKIGGQSSYMCYSSTAIYETENDFQLAAEANYQSITSYAGYTEAGSSYSKNVMGGSELYVIGGDITLPNQGDFNGWYASVGENPNWMNFTSSGLKPVWELCDDPDRAKILEDAFADLYTPHCSDEKREDHGKGGDFQVGKHVDNPNYFVTGFGGRINDNDHFSRCAVQFEDVNTGVRTWKVDGDKTTFNANDYELIGEVPDGCALTGIALTEHKNDLTKMKFYYQVVNRGHSTNHTSALDATINSMHIGEDATSYEVEYEPPKYNTRVIQGIEVSSSNSANSVYALYLYTAEFAMPIEQPD